MDAVRQSAAELKALIVKSADELQTQVDSLGSVYLAVSEYGTFLSALKRWTSEDSSGITDYLTRTEQINSELLDYLERIDGQIKRGWIEDPETHANVLGIAISQNLSVDAAQTIEDGGKVYYKINTNNFGLYTASGWQFWVNRQKAGWFDANNQGILHVRKVVAEDFFQVGGKWQMKVSDGGKELEFVYIGG
jgi:hypothetical protein